LFRTRFLNLAIGLTVVMAIISGCGGGGAPTATPGTSPAAATATNTASATSAQQPHALATASCPETIKQALDAVAGKCNAIGSNSVCFGNPTIQAVPANSNVKFSAPGDSAALADLKSIHTLPYNPATGTWGIAVMKAAVNLPGATAGQQVTLIMYGDTQLEAFGGDMQTISMRSGPGTQACDQLPPSGITVQVPHGQRIKFTINGVDISLGSTAVIKSDPNTEIEVAVLEGGAQVTAKGETVSVPAGHLVGVPLQNGQPISVPGPLEVITFAEVRSAPVSLLREAVSMQAVQEAINATFTPSPVASATQPTAKPVTVTGLPPITPLLTWTPGPTQGRVAATGTNRLAFASKQNNKWDIFVMQPDGSNLTRITNRDGDNRSPAWSPDGSRIAFAGFSGSVFQIFTVTDTGQSLTPLTGPDGSAEHPAWSPDGGHIVFDFLKDRTRQIAVVDTGGGGLTTLTSGSADSSEPAWSPDSSKIAFVSMRDGNPEIYVMNADGSSVKRLTDNAADDMSPVWSPDGSKIAWVSNRSGNNDIYVMNADGSSVTRVLSNPAGDTAPAWSPDGKQIAFISDRDGAPAIYVVPVIGGTPLRVTDLAADSGEPAWQH